MSRIRSKVLTDISRSTGRERILKTKIFYLYFS